MNDLIFIYENNEVFVSSIEIAEKFNIYHGNIVALIDEKIDFLPHDFFERNFKLRKYVDSSNSTRICYYVSREGFSNLVDYSTYFAGKDADALKNKFFEAFKKVKSKLCNTLNDKEQLNNKNQLVENNTTNLVADAYRVLSLKYFGEELRFALDKIFERVYGFSVLKESDTNLYNFYKQTEIKKNINPSNNNVQENIVVVIPV